MNKLWLLFFSLTALLEAHSLIFIHIGDAKPDYLPIAIAQARLFNQECPIYLIANQSTLDHFSLRLQESNTTLVSTESIPTSSAHTRFRQMSRRDTTSAKGYWLYTCERFFYLEEFIREHNLSDVFHFENDVMLYVDLEKQLPIFHTHYSNMLAVPFENDTRCCPGIVYISSPAPLTRLMDYFAHYPDSQEQDMHIIAKFKDLYKKTWIDFLPTVPPEYANDHPLERKPIPNLRFYGDASKEPDSYSNYFAEFGSVFDANAWGIYLDGVDPHFHVDAKPGYVGPGSVFSPAFFSFEWEVDLENRRVPIISYNGAKFPINNLHITSKRLSRFISNLPIDL